jgi:hypothetical protein
MITAADSKPKQKEIHPIWRGIGCILLFIIPLMSFAVAVLVVEENLQQGWFTIPPELIVALPVGIEAALPEWVTSYFLVKLLVAAAVAVMLFGLFTLFYSFVYGFGGGYSLKPGDVPPPRQKPRKRR